MTDEGRTVAERRVAELMTRDPLVIPADAPAARAERLMQERHITGLPVVDDAGALVGVISLSDLLHARSHEPFATDWPGLRVSRLMSKPAITIDASASVVAAARLMEEDGVHRLVVVDDDGKPIGLLSTMDFAHALARRPLSATDELPPQR